jgi:hypothetical protein
MTPAPCFWPSVALRGGKLPDPVRGSAGLLIPASNISIADISTVDILAQAFFGVKGRRCSVKLSSGGDGVGVAKVCREKAAGAWMETRAGPRLKIPTRPGRGLNFNVVGAIFSAIREETITLMIRLVLNSVKRY